MKHKIGILFTMFVCGLLCMTACGNASANVSNAMASNALDTPVMQAEAEYLSFENVIVQCTDIIEATYVGRTENTAFSELEFTVNQVLKGGTTEDTIFVTEQMMYIELEGQDLTYLSGNYTYEVGQTYLLLLERNISIYYDHDRYMLLGDVYIPLSETAESLMYGEMLDLHSDSGAAFHSANDVLSYVETYLASMPVLYQEDFVEYYGTEYVESQNPADIIACSGYVFDVEVGELLVEGVYAETETYYCTIRNILKGTLTSEELDARIYVVFFESDNVSPGDTYILMLNRADTASLVYTLSSENSVVAVEDGMEINTVEELLARTSENSAADDLE